MPSIRVDQFAGQSPKIDRHMLAQAQPVQCSNVDLRSKALFPIRQPVREVEYSANLPGLLTTAAKRVFPLLDASGNRLWVMFEHTEAALIRTPVLNDQYERVYFTEPGHVPRYAPLDNLVSGGGVIVEPGVVADGVLASAQIYDLGVPAPPAFTVGSTGGSATAVTRAYIATYYTIFGEEGAFSAPVLTTGHPDGTWTISAYPTANPDPDRPLKGVKIYRAGQTDTTYRLIRTVDFGSGTTTFNDTTSEVDLTGLPSAVSGAWGVPDPDLQGLVLHPNGFLAGFVGRDVFFSVPFVPSAWPAFYTVRSQFDIVALVVVGQSIVVLTKGAPMILTGTDPLSMTPTRFDDPVPCISARSAVSQADAVFYACPDGLARIDFGGPVVVTTNIVAREQWIRDWSTPSMIAVMWDATYLALTSSTTMFMMSISDPLFGMTSIQLPLAYDGMDVAPDNGNIYMLRAGNLDRWMSDTPSPPLALYWASKTFMFPQPTSLGAFQVKRGTDVRGDFGSDPLLQDKLAYNQARIAEGPLDGYDAYAYDGEIEIETPTGLGLPPIQPMGGEPLFDTTVQATGDIRFRLYGDGNLMFDGFVQDENTYRAASGYKATRWNFELVSYVPVVAVHIGQKPTDLAIV